MCRREKVVIITAPSGAGKTTLTNHLLQEMNDLEYSVSATTRLPREGEVDGIDYHYINLEEFKAKIAKDEFIEWEEVYDGIFYGTLKEEVERIWDKNKVAIFVVDVIGALDLKEFFKEKALSIFIKPVSMIQLKERLQARGTESESNIRVRVEKARLELKYAKKFDSVLLNDELERAKEEIFNLVDVYLRED